MGGDYAGYEAYKSSPLKYNGAILPPGCGLLGSMIRSQLTSNPVITAPTASTVTVTTSPVSLTTQKWEHYKLRVPAPQVGRIDPMRIGSTVTQPTMSGQPIILSQHAWPSLPAPLEKTIPTARADTSADDPKVQEDASDVPVAKPAEQTINEDDHITGDVPTLPTGLDIPTLALQEGEVNAEVVNTDSDAPSMTTQMDEVTNFVGAETDITATTIAELKCPYANCQYVTGVGQDCVQYGMEMYAAKYMQNELKIHCATKHTEYGDAAGTTDSKGWYKSSCRSNKSKKRNKSRRSNVESSDKVWDMLFYDGGTQLC